MPRFSEITKRLDITRVEKDSTLVTKPLTINKVRAIQKLGLSFVIPGFAGVPNPGLSTLFRQYNYTAPQDFSIFEITGYNPIILVYAMCIKYRVGNDVFRYRLPVTNNTIALDTFKPFLQKAVYAPDYTNQIIKKNFSIEFWSSSFAGSIVALADYTVKTSLYRNPANADEVEPVIDFAVAETMDRDALAVNFPEALPTVYPSGSAWLTN